jgi:hypothetical protein
MNTNSVQPDNRNVVRGPTIAQNSPQSSVRPSSPRIEEDRHIPRKLRYLSVYDPVSKSYVEMNPWVIHPGNLVSANTHIFV